jgi:hypothetical protein
MTLFKLAAPAIYLLIVVAPASAQNGTISAQDVASVSTHDGFVITGTPTPGSAVKSEIDNLAAVNTDYGAGEMWPGLFMATILVTPGSGWSGTLEFEQAELPANQRESHAAHVWAQRPCGPSDRYPFGPLSVTPSGPSVFFCLAPTGTLVRVRAVSPITGSATVSIGFLKEWIPPSTNGDFP